MAFGEMEDVWRASVGAAKVRNVRNAGLAARKTAQTEQRRQAVVSTNALEHLGQRKNRFPAAPKPTIPGQQQRYGGGSIVGKRDTSGEVAKGIIRQSVAPTQARVNPTASLKPRLPMMAKPVARAVIGKAGVGASLKAFRAATGAGRAGVKAKAVLPTARLGNVSRHAVSAGEKVGQGIATAERNPLATGVIAGSIGGGGLVAMRRNEGAGVAKAHGDPEDARYARLGAGAAGAAALGAGGLGYAAYDARRSTPMARLSSKFASNNTKFKRKQKIVEGRGASRTEREVYLTPRKVAQLGQDLHRSGYAMTRRGALAGVGGLAALGGAEALRRRASERRWN